MTTWSARIGQGLIYLVTAFVLLNSLWALFTAYAAASSKFGMGFLPIAYLLYLTAIPHVLCLLGLGAFIASKGWREARWQAGALAIGVLAPLPILVLVGAPAREQADRLHALHQERSFFTAEQMDKDFGSDLEMLTLIRTLQIRGNADQGTLLRSALERRLAKKILGEPYKSPRTVGEAIAAEKSPGEKIGPLRQRVAHAVTVQAAEGKVADTGAASKPAELRVRWLARNGTRVAVDRFNILLSEWTGIYEDRAILGCKPENDQPIPAQGRSIVECKPLTPQGMSPQAYAMLQDSAMAQPRPVTLIYPAGGDARVSAHGVYFGKIEQIAEAGGT